MNQFRNAGFLYQRFNVPSRSGHYFFRSHEWANAAQVGQFALPTLYVDGVVNFTVFFPLSGTIGKPVEMKPFAGQKQANYKTGNP